jgi:hypothetical protein
MVSDRTSRPAGMSFRLLMPGCNLTGSTLLHCKKFDQAACPKNKLRIADMPFNHFYSASYEKVTVIMPPRLLDIAMQNVQFNQRAECLAAV